MWKRAQYTLSICFYLTNNLNQAEIEFNKLINQYRGENDSIITRARYILTDIKLRLNQQFFDENRRNQMKYIRTASKLLKKVGETSLEYPEIWFRLAIVKSHLGHYKGAREIYQKLTQHFPENIPTKLSLAHIVIDTGNDLDYAEILLQDALELNEDYFNTWVGLINLRQKQGKKDDYYKACKKTIELASNDEEKKIANNNMGEYYREYKDYKKAIEYFQKALEIDKSFDNSIGGYIQCLWSLKNYEKIEEITKDLEFNKNNKYYLKIRAYSLSFLGRHIEALELINKCISIYVKDIRFLSDLYDSRGDFQDRCENTEEALKDYQKSLDIAEEEYEFTSETRKKIKNCKSKLNL